MEPTCARDAIIEAVKDALNWQGEQSLSTPVITVAQRAAYESAEISISADSGCSLYYTTDGSEPTAENTAINSNTLRLEPTGDKEITLKVLAVKGDAKSEVASTSIVFRQEREIILQIDKEASCYDNSEQINVTVSAGNADILYALDYLNANREGSLTDVAKNGVATEGDISVDFCEYPGGGTLVLQASSYGGRRDCFAGCPSGFNLYS